MELSFIVDNIIVYAYVPSNILKNFDEFEIIDTGDYAPIPYSFVLSEYDLISTIAEQDLDKATRIYSQDPYSLDAHLYRPYVVEGIYADKEFRSISSLMEELNEEKKKLKRSKNITMPIHSRNPSVRLPQETPQLYIDGGLFNDLSPGGLFKDLGPEELFISQAGRPELIRHHVR